MTSAQQTAILQYLGVIAPVLNLGDWTFIIADTTPGSRQALCDVEPNPVLRTATIQFAERWWTTDAETQRHALAHELVHCHFALPTGVFAQFGDVYPGAASMLVGWSQLFLAGMDVGVDAMATLLAPLLPLPACGELAV